MAQETENKLLRLYNSLIATVGAEAEIEDLINNHGEYGVALENLLSLVEDKSVALSKVQFEAILDLLAEMKFDNESIEYYRGNLKVES